VAQLASRRGSLIASWLIRPISSIWCVFSWLGASAIFFGLADALGGPTEGDAAESVYSTWAVAHGHLACIYPQGTFRTNNLADPFALTAPLYPLLSGAVAALLRIGRSVAFPSTNQLGPQCSTAFREMFGWSVKSSAILPTIRLSFIVWPILLGGTIMLLRAVGRGRCGWEPMAVFLLACTPPVLMCLVSFFHPQDLLAMGLALGALAFARNSRWLSAGLLIGLAFTSQQFVLLIAAPLLVIAPTRDKLRFALAALCSAAIVDVPLIAATSGQAFRTILLGSNRVGESFRSTGGTLLWELNLRGSTLFVVSRIVPVVAAMLLAGWASRRIGSKILESVPLISLVATSLALRLVFEDNLFGYYFMAVSVALVLLDVARGQIRGQTIAWIGLVTLAFNPVHWGFYSNWTPWDKQFFQSLPTVFMVLALVSMTLDAFHRRFHVYKAVWMVIVALTCDSQIWGMSQSILVLPNWLWQVVLVPAAVFLSVGPLISSKREHPARQLATTS
jgi:hypothetical protein